MTLSVDKRKGRVLWHACALTLVMCLMAGCGDADIRRGDAAMARQDFPMAVQAYEAALARDDQNVKARYRLVEALVSQINVGRAQGTMPLPELAAAIDRVHQVILPIRDEEPELLNALVNLHVSLARTYADANMPELARDTWRRVAELQPNADVHFNIGQASVELGDWEEAMAAFKDALALDPTHAEALKGLGNVYIQLRRDEDAVDAYNQVLEIRPNDTRTRYNLGVALARVGRLDDAIAQYERVIEEDPEYPLAYWGMRNAVERKGDAEGAAEWERKWREKAGLDSTGAEPTAESAPAADETGTESADTPASVDSGAQPAPTPAPADTASE